MEMTSGRATFCSDHVDGWTALVLRSGTDQGVMDGEGVMDGRRWPCSHAVTQPLLLGVAVPQVVSLGYSYSISNKYFFIK